MKMRNLYLERHERLDREFSLLSDTLNDVSESLNRIDRDKIDETTIHKNVRSVCYYCSLVMETAGNKELIMLVRGIVSS